MVLVSFLSYSYFDDSAKKERLQKTCTAANDKMNRDKSKVSNDPSTKILFAINRKISKNSVATVAESDGNQERMQAVPAKRAAVGAAQYPGASAPTASVPSFPLLVSGALPPVM